MSRMENSPSSGWRTSALRRIATVLRLSGLLRVRDLLLSCEIDEVSDVVSQWLANAAERPEDGWTRGELETHPAPGAQHVHLAVRTDAGACRIRDPRGDLQRLADALDLHVHTRA